MSEQPFSPDFQTNIDFENKELVVNQHHNAATATIYPATNISRFNYFRPLEQPVNTIYRYQPVNELGIYITREQRVLNNIF